MEQRTAIELVKTLGAYKYAAAVCRNEDGWYISVADPATVSSGGDIVRVEFHTVYLTTSHDVFKFITARE